MFHLPLLLINYFVHYNVLLSRLQNTKINSWYNFSRILRPNFTFTQQCNRRGQEQPKSQIYIPSDPSTLDSISLASGVTRAGFSSPVSPSSSFEMNTKPYCCKKKQYVISTAIQHFTFRIFSFGRKFIASLNNCMYANTKEDYLQPLCQATSKVLVTFFHGMCVCVCVCMCVERDNGRVSSKIRPVHAQ